MSNEKIDWITVNGNHIPIKEGQSVEEAVAERFDSLDRDNGIDDIYGYHAGDLGKAEYYFEQGGSRGTGHFGTGTYFVGNEDEINIADYKDRPHHKIDFSKYNLYRPKDEEEGYKLHNLLKQINNGTEYLDSESRKKKEDIVKNSKRFFDYSYNGYFRDINELEVFDNFDEFKEFYNNMVDIYNDEYPGNKLNKIDYNIDNYDEFQFDENGEEIYKEILKNSEELFNDIRPNMIERRLNETENMKNKFYNLFGDKDKVDKALNKTREIEKNYDSLGGRYSNNAKKWDSLSTVFMKNMGYEGVDVRKYKGLDNTEFGSVIYDLKK